MDEWDLLTERQQEQAEGYAELATQFGQFDQSAGADGAHYAVVNPFKADGIKCGNCVFYTEETKQCQIVSGAIDPEAVCKLWVIPETSIMAARNLSMAKAKLISWG
jgi:hypothetical protein